MKLVLYLSQFFLISRAVVLEQTSPFPVCPSDDVTFTCTVTVIDTFFVNFLAWFNPDNASDRNVYYFPDNSNQNVNKSVGSFMTVLVQADSNVIVSTATLAGVTVKHDSKKRIICQDSKENEDIRNAILSGSPDAPVKVTSAAVSVSSVLLSWRSPSPTNNSCPPATYIIAISAGSLSLNLTVMEFNSSDAPTSKEVTGLTQGLEYSFVVLGIDAGGRVGKKSTPVNVFILDVPEEVQDLSSSYSDTVITVTWMPPHPSSRPSLMGYKISYNTTGSTLVNETEYTTFVFEGVAPGFYHFTVLAFNVLGNGREENVTVHISTKEANAVIIAVVCTLGGVIVIALLSAGVLLLLKKLKDSSVPISKQKRKTVANPRSKDQEGEGVEYSLPDVMMVVEPRVEAQKNPAYGTTTLETRDNLAYASANLHVAAYDSDVQYNHEYI